MIFYTSTRGDQTKYTFSQAIVKGIAKDGGLFIPNEIPLLTTDQLKTLLPLSYQQRAAYILDMFQLDFSKEVMNAIVKKAYSSNFDTEKIAPTVHLKDNQYMIELWHGPTAAFKDMALQIMPLFFSETVKKDNEKRVKDGGKPLQYLILVATSGDTGKAALEGYKDKECISIVVFYPEGHVSQLQQLQMSTQEGENVGVFSVTGDFDDVQTMVKDIFNDKDFNAILAKKSNTVLSSANSINWARLLPQIVYHMSSYLDLVKQNAIAIGEKVDIAVPTGNFGNILAAYYAKKMGLPVGKLICCSNENNVLTDFLHTGIYDITKRKLVSTPSPSMDILIASNIERLLYLVTNDSGKVSQWMEDLKRKGSFIVDSATKHLLQDEFYADWVSNTDCLSNIKAVYKETHYLMDPHTSVAQVVTEKYIDQTMSSIPVLICATAHWTKFAKDIYKALDLGIGNTEKDEFKMLEEIQRFAPKEYIPTSISTLKGKKQLHTQIVKADKKLLEDMLIRFASTLCAEDEIHR